MNPLANLGFRVVYRFRSRSAAAFVPMLLLAALLAGLCSPASAAESPVFEQLRAFGNTNAMAAQPFAPVVEDSDGWLYGTTFTGGALGKGCIYRVQRDGTGFAVIHSFGLSPGDGHSPWAGLTLGSDGLLYGVTSDGGADNFGVIFKLAPDGTGYTLLHHFASGTSDGHNPRAALIEASDGALYGVCYKGGASDKGTVFKLNRDGTGYGVLYHFPGGTNNGENPLASLLEGSDGVLYGTTEFGGNQYTESFTGQKIGVGVIFKLNKNGSSYGLVKKFSASNDARHCAAPLIEATNGMLYGSTPEGGSEYTDEFGTRFTAGVVFRLNKNGSSYGIIRQFLGVNDAQNPTGGLVQGSNGRLYGTSEYDDPTYSGTLYQIALDGSEYAVLFRFSNTNGQSPTTPMIQAADGQLYGTTSKGGGADAGALFRFDPATASQSVVHHFSPTGGDSGELEAPLLQASDGWLYGVSRHGGFDNAGTIFKMQPTGDGFEMLHSFANDGFDGLEPTGRLLEGSDGALYGTTYYGGTNLTGTLFKLNNDGTDYAVLHHFKRDLGDPRNPAAGVVEGADGLLYGTSAMGGTRARGTVFRVSRDGTGFTVLYHFTGTGFDGRNPAAPLFAVWNGFFYGTTPAPVSTYGSDAPYGTLFRIRPDGSGYFPIYVFGSSPNDGRNPSSGLMHPGNGWLYGTTAAGGLNDRGTVYRVAGDLSDHQVLKSFTGGDGERPVGGVELGPDGALYGTTSAGGLHGGGTLYRLDPDGGNFTVLRHLGEVPGEGRTPRATLLAASDGALYGTTAAGGTGNIGTIFRYGADTPAAADVGVNLAASPNPAPLGGELIFTIVVSNAGPALAETVLLTNALPAGLSFQAATPSQGSCGFSDGVLECALGNLDPAAAVTITLQVSPAALAELTNHVTVSAATPDPNPANNSAAVALVVQEPPLIITGPLSVTATNGGAAQFSVAATGSALQFQWSHDGIDLPGATTDTLLLVALSQEQAGGYQVTVANAVGSVVSSPAVLTVLEPPTLSVIADQTTPEDTPIAVPFQIGDAETAPAELQLTAASNDPGLVPESGLVFAGTGIDRTLTLTPAADQFGIVTITVTVLDADGLSAQAAFSLEVTPVPDLPMITAQPQDATVPEGAPVTLTVAAEGLPPMTFQWQRAGLDVAGATEPTFVIAGVQAGDAGTYAVVVTGPEGAVTSASAQVRVLIAPMLEDAGLTSGRPQFTFATRKDATYVVEYSDSLPGAPWVALPPVAGTGDPVTFTDPDPLAGSRFYRVRVE